MRNWHTGHSLAAGVVTGLLLSRHAWMIGVAFGVGLVLGRFWATLAALGRRFLGYGLTSRSRTPW